MDLHGQHNLDHKQVNSGLTRYRSAPSSYFSTLLDANGGGDDNILAALNNRDMQQSYPEAMEPPSSNYPISNMNDAQKSNNFQFSGSQQANYQGQGQQQLSHGSTPAFDDSYLFVSSINSGGGSGGSGRSGLIRYNSSPAGLFANINIQEEFSQVRGQGNFRAGNTTSSVASFSPSSMFQNQMDSSSAQPSSSGRMSPIPEIGDTSAGKSSPVGGNFAVSRGTDGSFLTGFPLNSWDDSAILSDDLLKELEDDDIKTFSHTNASENQISGAINRPPTLLSRHMSLPQSSAELSAVEKLMQDSVPWKVRAKRGCATHPRSVAERVRRTKISERMRKLQGLVPNMDKQTNTSDMLDLAVDYIKDLEQQVKTLKEIRAKCTCSNK